MRFEELPNSETKDEVEKEEEGLGGPVFKTFAAVITFAVFSFVLLAIIAGCVWLIRYIW